MIRKILEHPSVEYASINCDKVNFVNVVVRKKNMSFLKEECYGPRCQYEIEKLVDKILKQLNNEFIRDEDLI